LQTAYFEHSTKPGENQQPDVQRRLQDERVAASAAATAAGMSQYGRQVMYIRW